MKTGANALHSSLKVPGQTLLDVRTELGPQPRYEALSNILV